MKCWFRNEYTGSTTMKKSQEVKAAVTAKMVGGWMGSRMDTGAPGELKMLLPRTWVVVAQGFTL